MKKLNTTLLIVGLGLIGLITIAAVTTVTTVPQNLANLVCADTSGSGTAQVCTTTPSFTIATGSSIVYTTTTANTGDLTINVNSLGAKHVRKRGSARVLSNSDIPANVSEWLTYNGSSWEMYEGQLVESDLSLSDNTTNNVSTSQHGFAPKADGSATDFLNGLGAYSAPSGLGYFLMTEDWCGGLANEGTLGKNGWLFDPGADGLFHRDSTSINDVNHPCSISLITGTGTSSERAFAYLTMCGGDTNADFPWTMGGGSGCGQVDTFVPTTNSFPALGSQTFDSTCVFEVNTVTNLNGGCGFYDFPVGNNGSTCGKGPVSNGKNNICALYSAADGDTMLTFQVCGSSAGTCTRSTTNSFTPTAGDWIKARIRSTVAGTILMSACQSVPPAGCTLGAETSLTGGNVPTTTMTPNIGVSNGSNAAHASVTMAVNYFEVGWPVSR